MDMSNLGFDEALARLINADPRELAAMNEQVDRRVEKVKLDVEQQRKLIATGGRTFKRTFRP